MHSREGHASDRGWSLPNGFEIQDWRLDEDRVQRMAMRSGDWRTSSSIPPFPEIDIDLRQGRHVNEGRSLNSGDTTRSRSGPSGLFFAQRRPESELRRHPRPSPRASGRRCSLNEGRSLNSGDTNTNVSSRDASEPAQRRPESELRRHAQYTAHMAANPVRAQRRPESELRRHRPLPS